MQDEDEDIGQSHMPYPTEVKGMAPINYRQAPVKTSTSDGGGRIRGDEQRVERHARPRPSSRPMWATRCRCTHS